MSLRIVVQMDPIQSIDIRGDTTFALMLEAQARGYSLWTYHPRDLVFREGQVTARARPVRVQPVAGAHAHEGDPVTLDLKSDADMVLMRQDPPFDMSYITACHILELIQPDTLVVNDPGHVRSSPEKLLPLDFPDLIPPTLITRSLEAIKAFRADHGTIIVKPLYGNGGTGVFRLDEGDPNLAALTEMFFAASREPVMVQAYLKAVEKGDKRVILIDGEPVGAINRVPQKGEARSNMHVGGRAEASDLDAADRAICTAIGPLLKARGLTLVGIDVIGGRLTEINVTSPTGVQELKRFSGIDTAALFWDAVHARLK